MDSALPSPRPMPMQDPGEALSVVGAVLVALFPPAAIVFGIIGRNRSRDAGFPGTLGTVAMWLGIVVTAVCALCAIAAWLALKWLVRDVYGY